MSLEETGKMVDQNQGRVREQLVRLAADRPQIYMAAQDWFSQQGERIVPALVQGLEEEDLGAVCHRRILLLLRYFAKEETIPAILKALRRALRNGNHIVIPGAMEAVAVFHTPEALQTLMGLTQASDPDIVKHAAVLLGQTQDAAAVEPLLSLLASTDPFIRYSAVKALLQLEVPTARAALVRHLETETDAEILVLLHSAGLGKPGMAP